MGESAFYKMPAFATLAVVDPPATAEWYREALGFREISRLCETEKTPGFVHIRRERYQDILLVSAASGSSVGEILGSAGGARLTFRTDEDIDELAARAHAAGGLVVEGPTDTSWNAREVTVQDVDGYRITFSRFSWISGLF